MKIVPRKIESDSGISVGSINYGFTFLRKGNDSVFMRVKPTGFILNSNLLGDIINRNDVLIVDLKKGTLYCIHGEEKVDTTESELHVPF